MLHTHPVPAPLGWWRIFPVMNRDRQGQGTSSETQVSVRGAEFPSQVIS